MSLHREHAILGGQPGQWLLVVVVHWRHQADVVHHLRVSELVVLGDSPRVRRVVFRCLLASTE